MGKTQILNINNFLKFICKDSRDIDKIQSDLVAVILTDAYIKTSLQLNSDEYKIYKSLVSDIKNLDLKKIYDFFIDCGQKKIT